MMTTTTNQNWKNSFKLWKMKMKMNSNVKSGTFGSFLKVFALSFSLILFYIIFLRGDVQFLLPINETKRSQLDIALEMTDNELDGCYHLYLVRIFSTWAQFHQRATYSFCARRSQKHKKILTTWLNSYASGTYECKSCT